MSKSEPGASYVSSGETEKRVAVGLGCFSRGFVLAVLPLGGSCGQTCHPAGERPSKLIAG